MDEIKEEAPAEQMVSDADALDEIAAVIQHSDPIVSWESRGKQIVTILQAAGRLQPRD